MLESREATDEEKGDLGLSFRLHEPLAGAGKRAGVFFVHGRSGDEKVTWIFSKTLQAMNPVVLSPQAHLADPIGGWSWWPVEPVPPETRRRTTWEGLLPALEKLEVFIERAVERFNLDPQHLFSLGFSQGAALLAALSLRKPELFQGVAILSSFIPPIIFETPERLPVNMNRATRKPKYFIYHGTEDAIVFPDRATRARDYLVSVGCEVELVTEPVKHKVGAQGMRRLGEWFAQHLTKP